jgi:hypothetical protein
MAVALRDYLDRRKYVAAKTAIAAAVGEEVASLQEPVRPPKSPRSPCPCGSGQQYRHCHGKAA